MIRITKLFLPVLAILALPLLASSAMAQVGPDGKPLSREQMWRHLGGVGEARADQVAALL